MNPLRRHLVALLALLPIVTLPAVCAATDLVEGRDWKPVDSDQAPADTDQITVVEFFSYGCPHCADLNPLIEEWKKDLPEDVAFERSPVTFGRAAWEMLGRLYYALQFSGDLERLDQAVFDAVTKDRTNLFTEKAVLAWVAKQGVDKEKFAELFNSFAVEAALARASTAAARFRVNAVPRIIVDGRYEVVGEGATKAGLLEITDGLIEKARAARADAS
jgi:thiol:disulfide interchange protein DsbA